MLKVFETFALGSEFSRKCSFSAEIIRKISFLFVNISFQMLAMLEKNNYF